MSKENGTEPEENENELDDALEMLGQVQVRKDLRITVYFQPDGNPIVASGKASPIQLMAAAALMSELGRFQLHQHLAASARQQQQQQQQIQIARLGNALIQ